MVPQAMRYIVRNAAAQWVALVANIVLMLLIGLFLQGVLDLRAAHGGGGRHGRKTLGSP